MHKNENEILRDTGLFEKEIHWEIPMQISDGKEENMFLRESKDGEFIVGGNINIKDVLHVIKTGHVTDYQIQCCTDGEEQQIICIDEAMSLASRFFSMEQFEVLFGSRTEGEKALLALGGYEQENIFIKAAEVEPDEEEMFVKSFAEKICFWNPGLALEGVTPIVKSMWERAHPEDDFICRPADPAEYDKVKAKLVGIWVNKYLSSPDKKVFEELYRLKNGKFFLIGNSGINSWLYVMDNGIKRRDDDRERTWPLDEWEAQIWVMRFLPTEAYIKLFGEVDEMEKVVMNMCTPLNDGTFLAAVKAQGSETREGFVNGYAGNLCEWNTGLDRAAVARVADYMWNKVLEMEL